MKKWISNSLLVVAAFAMAVVMHNDFYQASQYSTPAASVSGREDGTPKTQVSSFNLVGVSARVSLDSDARHDPGIQGLWQEFMAAKALHESVDWSKLQTTIAYYDNFDAAQNKARLTIGYPQSSLGDSVTYKARAIAAGEYRHYQLQTTGMDEVAETWNHILASGAWPSAVIERYGLTSLGETRSIQIQTLD